ncbi:ribose utilization transcriptional repressor RbsR [Levilactobacillus brevis]|uniref:LacI family DNA-binding transcriptional regulator n=1 Tax=Levilactobacillus brevis TaxID=1580 RepID=A0AA41EQL3_LEVBR|nr:LacI family DNA-binding transcriptional regulator [Levilactobacillus brevis]MBS0947884.1 LacI family DNA-binding transcriptional regulator [Levilactobacillus brevis]MBS0977321.1 LacI family DNA-binding transcriptional regulator [Levilactobacillus brevis]MBS1004826.1 LacI family DNA-binding transcriptional regulator [Levilactobacillus brevis]MBS1011074.1 LacI family DNA-binding transcriptional regulator [Levilactobacillus brevis]MBS1012360.1 LacI family DNA-binding transcriptional regulator 
MTRKVTIRDLAEAAGVSVTTVSQILNGKGERFSIETRQRVHQLQEDLGYVPDFNARNLIMKSAQTIGVLVPNLGNPFFSMFIRGVQQTSRERHFIPLIFGANHDEQLESYYLQELIKRAVDGLIIASASITGEAIDNILKKNGIPYLLIDQNGGPSVDRIRVDDEQGGQLAARHLLALGHQRIVVVMPEHPTQNLRIRLAGFKAQLVDQQIPLADSAVITSPMTKLGGYQATAAVLAQHPTAVFAINDETALGLMRGLHEQGVRVPDDISVLGYDDIDLDEYVVPKLTTIHQPVVTMGQQATELLINRVQNQRQPAQMVDLPVVLKQRESTGPVK